MNDKAQTNYREYAKRQVGTITEALTEVMLGNFSAVARTSEPDETFGYLCAMINVAINAARNAQQDLQAKIVELETEVAERKQAEAALRESEEQLQLALGASRAGTFDFDVATQRCTWDDRSLEIYGLSETKRCVDAEFFYSLVHPEDRPHLRAVHEQVLASESRYRVDYRIRRPDDDERYVQARGVILRNDQGEAIRVIGMEFDITERKRAEEQIRQLNENLTQRALALEVANEELESFAYSVSHDLRAPLRAIDGFAEILADDYAESLPQQAHVYLQTIQHNAQQMDRLIEALLTFSRLGRQALNPQRIDVAELTREVFEGILRHEDAQRCVELTVGAMPACQADPALLKQVWVNLLSNASKFTRGREAARIEVGSVQEKGEVVYFVKDNGVGFDMAYAEKLFGVFERLHLPEEYEGTGVGLALVQRIVRRHGGRVWAEAAQDEGATFYFTLR